VDSVTVDRKRVQGDRFDDLSIRDARGFVRRQLKWSEPGTRALTVNDFVRTGSSLRIDLLIQSQLGLTVDPANE
jgi:hypothetical protein